MPGRSDETVLLLQAESPAGRQRVLADLFTHHRDRLRRMVQIRLHRKLQARVDPSDVLQEAFIEASRRLDEYCRRPSMPVFLWFRQLTSQRLLDAHRFHLRSKRRSAGREVRMGRPWLPSQTGLLAESLLGKEPSPSQAAIQAEAKARLEEALEKMDAVDCEVIALRHFERLTAGEAAEVLGIRLDAAKKRYVRAMLKLRKILMDLPGAEEELNP
jgi:RNA polymerase sigma-70 factor (ECF subfamily)